MGNRQCRERQWCHRATAARLLRSTSWWARGDHGRIIVSCPVRRYGTRQAGTDGAENARARLVGWRLLGSRPAGCMAMMDGQLNSWWWRVVSPPPITRRRIWTLEYFVCCSAVQERGFIIALQSLELCMQCMRVSSVMAIDSCCLHRIGVLPATHA